MSALQRMIVLPPETFEKWKKLILEDSKLSSLDKEMKKILYNKNLNGLDKWHHYRQNLMQYVKKNKPTYNLHNISTQTVKENVSSKVPFTRNTGAQTYTDYLTMGTQTEDNFISPKKKDTFKRSKISKKDSLDDFNDPSIFSSLGDINLSKDYSEPSDVEIDQDDSLRRKALEDQPKDVKIVRERMSTNPNEYRSYDLSNGEIITVPITTRRMMTREMLNQPLHGKIYRPYVPKKRKKPVRSTPTKKQDGGKIKWKIYK